jgi:hypothetical protein
VQEDCCDADTRVTPLQHTCVRGADGIEKAMQRAPFRQANSGRKARAGLNSLRLGFATIQRCAWRFNVEHGARPLDARATDNPQARNWFLRLARTFHIDGPFRTASAGVLPSPHCNMTYNWKSPVRLRMKRNGAGSRPRIRFSIGGSATARIQCAAHRVTRTVDAAQPDVRDISALPPQGRSVLHQRGASVCAFHFSLLCSIARKVSTGAKSSDMILPVGRLSTRRSLAITRRS